LWIATEDNDFDEMKSFSNNGKKIIGERKVLVQVGELSQPD
jgi:hypothetical protein